MFRARILAPYALVAGLSASAAQAAGKTMPVTFAVNAWIGFAPLFVASHEHYFGSYPLKYIHMEDGVNTALISSNVDIADLSMNEVVSDHVKGFDVKIVMPIDYSNGADAIVTEKKVTTVKELRGLTIPLDTTSYSELLLAYALHQNQLSLRDVKTTNMPASSVPAALLGGHSKAGVTWAPHISLVTNNPAYHTVFTSAEAPGLITDNLSSRTAFLKAHPDAIPAIIQGFLKGRTYIKEHPKTAFQIVGKELGISPADAEAQYKQVISPSLNEMKYMMDGQGSYHIIPYSKNIALVENLMVTQGQITDAQKIKPGVLLDTRFVTASK